jgi:hypothetical protein
MRIAAPPMILNGRLLPSASDMIRRISFSKSANDANTLNESSTLNVSYWSFRAATFVFPHTPMRSYAEPLLRICGSQKPVLLFRIAAEEFL